MPSPSLGFFGQSKTSASNSSSQKATQARNTLESYIPSLQRLNASNKSHDPRLLHAPGKIPKMENNATFSGNVRVSGSSTECSVPCASSDVSHENRRFKLEGNNMQKVEAMIPCYSKRSDSMKENQEVDAGKGFQECGEPYKVEDIKSLEFQNKENVPNVTSNIYKSSGSENLCSNGPPHESPEQAYECAAEVDQLRDKLQVEDVQVHFMGTASSSECCDNKLCTSEVHDQYLVVDDDNKKTGEPPDPQNHCLLIEQTSELNHGSLLDDYLMFSKSTPAEESHGVHGLEIALNVIPAKDDDPVCNLNCSNVLITQGPGVIQDGGADVQDIVEKPQAKKALSTSADIVPAVENHNTPAEESHGVHGLEIALNVIPAKDDDPVRNLNCSNVLITQGPGAIQDGGADVQDIVEKPQAKKALSTSADIVPAVENHKYYIDTQFRVDLSLTKSRDHTTGTVTTCNPMALCSLIKEEAIGANGLKNNILAEKAETKVSSDKPIEETQRIRMNGGILFGEKRSLGEFHTGDLGSTVDVSLKNQGSAGSELKSCQTASLFKYAKQAKEVAATVDKMTNELCVGDAKVESLVENLLEGSSNSILSNSAIDSHCLKVVADDGQSVGLPEPQTPSLVVDHVFQEKHCMYLNDHLLVGKSTSSEELQEEKVLANVQVAHDQSDDDRSESKSSIGVIQVPLSMQDSGVDIEGMAVQELVEDAPSGSADTATSNEYDKSSIDTLRNDMVFFGQASSESDSVLMMRDNQTFGVSNTCNRLCMSEEPVFLVQKEIQANETNVVDVGIDKMTTITPDGIVVKVSQTNVGPSGELLHKLENTFCLAEDEDTAMPIKKSEDHGKQNSLIIKPPIYAVPFSDEWLAAMEAAGEEILTMKSGAVQNSPPDKCLPEPGPWSPVKRKQNDIGPFDCTKFINIPPPDSS
ncbi:Serine-rich adhesin for platelets like [Actinidia chinensis var. chinensis]|uniref:Serine-rich adhesin for platelets like n=1 Tax=Actinidia chinensis var. chinensis TaxID=1590841 RepID=A0A2R6P7K5_ACTCC|nr:Serine-rich adhesin for platelets like [Actinidia chinensis var. chinensis]